MVSLTLPLSSCEHPSPTFCLKETILELIIFLFHSRFAFLAFGGDGAKKENEKISNSKSDDSQDFSDHFDEDYGDDQSISTVAPNGLGTSKFLANS